jgi:hypothetical protein
MQNFINFRWSKGKTVKNNLTFDGPEIFGGPRLTAENYSIFSAVQGSR